MKTTNPSILITLLAFTALGRLAAETPVPPSWQLLLDGNAGFVSGKTAHPHQDPQRRSEVSASQKPFAVIIGCADSRTSPELIFDQGLGDIFTVRLAGNIVDDAALGSVEFAVTQLGARLIVVLGHEKCGAVTAAVQATKGGALPGGHIAGIVEAIIPAAESVKDEPGDTVHHAIHANVRNVITRIRTSSELLKPLLDAGELTIVGACYDLAAGKVETLK